MASDFSQLQPMGEVIKSPETESELEWRLPNFISLMDRDDVFWSPTFSFAGTIWRFSLYVYRNYLNPGIIREFTIPSTNLEVSVALKTVTGKKDGEGCAERKTSKRCEVYVRVCCFHKTELLKRKSDLLPSNLLTVFYTLKFSKAAKDAGGIATSKCSYCKDIVDNKDISLHQNKCVDKPIKCPECSEIAALKNWYEHKCETARTEGGIATSKCSYCKDIVDDKDISLHQNKCVDKPIKCPECSEITALKNWYEHKCQTARTEGEPSGSASSNALQENKVLNDLKELFLKKEDCDVVIKVQGQEFPAHKTILQARSPVLASIFRNDMKEKSTGNLDIEDCDPSSFSDFLCFLYCGDTDVISKDNVISLFTMANKYDVQDLRETCVEFMKKNLSVDTFCETITLALRHSEIQLIKLTTDFFIENAKEITQTVKWQSFVVQNPIESNELIVKFFASK